MRNSKLIFVGVVLALISGCADKEAQREAAIQKAQQSDDTVPVTFVTPKVMGIDRTLEITGPLKALDEVQLGAKIAGRLVLVTVKDGSPVRRGQVIARVETADIMQQIQQALAAVQVASSARQQALIQARVSPLQSAANIRQAQAAVNSARANLNLVRKGARSQERSQAQERVTQAKARLDKTKADLDRAKKLYENGAMSRSDVDAAQWNYDSALSDYRTALEAMSMLVEGARPEELSQAAEALRQAQEQLALAKANSSTDLVRKQQLQQADAQLRQAQASLKLAQMQLADASVTSPVDGYVSGKTAQVGQVVGAGTPICTVVSLNGVYLEGQIPETQLPNVSVGQSAKVTLDAFPNLEFSGTVVALRPAAEQLGRMFAARISIYGANKSLRPGMFGRAVLVLKRIPGAILVPADSVLKLENQSYVYVANGQVAHKVPVRLGVTKNGWVQVVGLANNQRVIVQGKDSVSEGTKIREDKQPSVEARK